MELAILTGGGAAQPARRIRERSGKRCFMGRSYRRDFGKQAIQKFYK
jgi:hypothetical protein